MTGSPGISSIPSGTCSHPARAEWFRCPGGVAHGPDGPRELGDAFELFATSVDGPQRTRLSAAAERMLAGRVIRARDGWATLATARYSACDVPVGADRGQEVWASLAEYVVRDEHGNVSVADTLLLSLAGRDPAPTRKEGRS